MELADGPPHLANTVLPESRGMCCARRVAIDLSKGDVDFSYVRRRDRRRMVSLPAGLREGDR